MMQVHSVIVALAIAVASSGVVRAENKAPVGGKQHAATSGKTTGSEPREDLARKDGSAAADSPRRPCAEDLKKFCPQAKPGSPQAFQCLKKHRSKLSDACKAGILDRNRIAQAGRRGGMKGFLRVCRADIDKHCPGVQSGGGRYISCLKQHESELSEACKNALPQSGEVKKLQRSVDERSGRRHGGNRAAGG